MSDLKFSFSLEQNGSSSFLTLDINDPSIGKDRILYPDQIRKGAGKDLASLLLKEHFKNAGVAPLSSYADTLPCNKIRISPARALECIKLLAIDKKLHWQGKSLFFNPFAAVQFLFLVEQLDDDALQVSSLLRVDGKETKLEEVDFLFPCSPLWVVKDRTVFILPEEGEDRLLLKTYPKPLVLKGRQKTEFMEDYKEDKHVVWKGNVLEAKPIEALPYLALQDAHGAFANLWMDYGAYGTVAFHDPKVAAWRDLSLEKAWERDLLETDFIKKIVGSSQYYCPLDKVCKSLSFLLEIGWKVFDLRGRVVCKQLGADLNLELQGQMILAKGRMSYQDHLIDIKNVVGAFNRREKFVELSPSAVGLLDREKVEEDLGGLVEAEILDTGLSIKKQNVGLLEDFLSKKHKMTAGVASLLERVKGAASPGEALPSSLFQGSLYPYQQQGVNWLYFLRESGFSGLLADEMGLGKTVQFLAFFSQISSAKPLLLVAPTSLLFNWKREFSKFLPGVDVYIHSGMERCREKGVLLEKRVILTSYSYLRIDAELLCQLDYECIVLDEAQLIKNPESQVAASAYLLQGSMKLAITGTPIENKGDDLWSLFRFLEPELLGERKGFQAEILAAQSDERYLRRIKKKIKPFLLRRTKSDVAQDLPEKIEQTVWVDMSAFQRGLYEEWLAKNRSGLLQKVKQDGVSMHRMEIFEAILRLRQIACHPLLVDPSLEVDILEGSGKLQQVLSDVEQIVEEGRKVVVFSQFTQMLKILEAKIKERSFGYAYLDGATKDREGQVNAFQEDPNVQVFLMSLKAGGVGLNLTAADYVFLFDPWWNEAAEAQALDRAHRFGRKNVVIARRYVAVESIEEKIMRLKEHKAALARGLLELQESSPFEMQDLLQLLE